MRVIAVITDPEEVRKILRHLVKNGRMCPKFSSHLPGYFREVFEAANPFSNIVLPVKEMMRKRYEVLINL